MNRIAFLVLELGRFRLAFPLWILEELLAFAVAVGLIFRGRARQAFGYLVRPRLGFSAYRKGDEVFAIQGLRAWVWRPF